MFRLRALHLTAFFYPENTGLVDFVAKNFPLSDQRQLTRDERLGSFSAHCQPLLIY
jgi:hypothetical protein